jgi:hypothetical protein
VPRSLLSRLLLPLLALPGILLLAAGCASHREPPPFEIHSALITSSHYLGTPLSGPIAGDPSKIDLTDSLDVHIDWFSVQNINSRDTSILASQATLVTAKISSQAVLPSTSLTSDARIAWLNDAPSPRQLVGNYNPGANCAIGRARSALPVGVTTLFRAVETGGRADQTFARPEPRYVEIAVTRAADNQMQYALAVQDSQPGQSSAVFQREVALFQHKRTNPQTALVLIVPFSFTGPTNHAVAAVVTVSDAIDDPSFKPAIDQCKSDLQSTHPGEVTPVWTLGLQRAMKELDDPAHVRAAVVYLATQGDSQICQDVAMLADEKLLNQIAGDIKRDAPAAIEAGNLDEYSWVLDRSAIRAMQSLLVKANLPPELFAIFTQYFGEPGRHSAAVDEVMRGVSSRHDLQLRLASENYIYLEDSSPASRVRAFQWLTAQKLAPKGYDPLAPPKQRRQALDQALSGDTQ